uniref:Uncharacterized protein n=1 Tax=Anguilla anguilla TaxID=7936 RepID=A0A0E9UE67_ANGAN
MMFIVLLLLLFLHHLFWG